MKTKIIFLTVLSIFIFPTCEKSGNKDTCHIGRIIYDTCGGVIIQILDISSVGETWSNFFITPVIEYDNCVLAPNIPSSKSTLTSEIYFNFTVVDNLAGGPYCEIGGLPKIKIKITDMFDTKCPD